MKESYFSLGLMSGTSMDGVDASIIKSNGIDECKTIFNEYYRRWTEYQAAGAIFINKQPSRKTKRFASPLD